MSVVMGIDSDKAMGWAAFDVSRSPSAIESGSLKLDGDTVADRLVDMRNKLVPIISKFSPIFAAVEAPRMFLTEHETKDGRKVDESPHSIVKQGTYAGAACMAFLCWNVPCIYAAPNSWQTVIPDNIKRSHEGKKRVEATCNLLKIVSPNMSSRDAALIAFWAAGRPEFKYLRQLAEKAA
jgi:Holliday junction resolvasome RuvABC endonuclease subunit